MRHIFMTICSAALIVFAAAPASAGGSWLEPSWERVEAGDHIELSGDVSTGQLGWTNDGPYFAYLVGDEYGTTIREGSGGAKTDVALGELAISANGNGAQASIAFTLPNETPPGEYRVVVCNEPCEEGFGDLLGAILYVGIDPPIEPEPAVETGTPNTPTLTSPAVTAVALVETAAPPSISTVTAHLMLAPHPSRSTNLAPTWVAVSAGLAAVVLLLALFTRRSDTQ
jgi:hypothetical protein